MRINRQLIKKAHNINPLLPYLLPQCRTIENASTELRWLTEHFQSSNKKLKQACFRRYHGMPLQYILGTQPFGQKLDILCRKNVLIPRWETDEICTFINDIFLKRRLEQGGNEKRVVLDLCTGSGCISATIKESYKSVENMYVYGIDVSPACIQLSKENQAYNTLDNNEGKTWLGYILGDVLNPSTDLINRLKRRNEWTGKDTTNDVFIECIVSNPPYIPTSQLPELNISVKKFEPHKALFGDLEFYENFVHTWSKHCNSFFYELGNEQQYSTIKNGLNKKEWTVKKWIDGNNKLRGVYGYRTSLAKDYEHYI